MCTEQIYRAHGTLLVHNVHRQRTSYSYANDIYLFIQRFQLVKRMKTATAHYGDENGIHHRLYVFRARLHPRQPFAYSVARFNVKL